MLVVRHPLRLTRKVPQGPTGLGRVPVVEACKGYVESGGSCEATVSHGYASDLDVPMLIAHCSESRAMSACAKGVHKQAGRSTQCLSH